jgi:hypothetical protein|tara:strand:- start:1994 stop:2128 length:135 start_codon:yes stop_codon:yes gene_type:complete
MKKQLIIDNLMSINKILNDGRLEDGTRVIIASAKISDLLGLMGE